MKKQNETAFTICVIVCIFCMIFAGYFSLVSVASREKTSSIAMLLMSGCMASWAVAIKTPTQRANKKLQAFFTPCIVLSLAFVSLAITGTIAHQAASEIISWIILIVSGAAAITLYMRARKEKK